MLSDSATTAPHTIQPRLKFWQIFNMSFGFLGIQFGFELQNSNVSRIFETMGANKDEIAILWIAAPVTGLLVQPIVGYLSDRTWHPYWGRRRPYFFIGAVLATIALILMPNSSALWMASGMLWIMDASINLSMEPFRAFVGDKLPPEQRTQGFAMQSFFIGIGSVIAALLPWIFTNWFHIQNMAGPRTVPNSVKWAFYFGAFAYLVSVMYTVFTTREFPPENISQLKKENAAIRFWDAAAETFGGIFKMPKTMRQLAWVQFFTWFSLYAMWIYSTNAITSNLYNMKVDKSLITHMDAILTQKMQSAELDRSEKKIIIPLKNDILEVYKFRSNDNPATISLNLANYFTAIPNTNLSTTERTQLVRVKQQFNDGADWISVCSSIRNGVAAIFAFIIPFIAFKTNRKITHLICLITGGVGLLSISIIPNPHWLPLSMALVGVAWASILSMPYAILSGSLPSNKMGYYMGVFNFCIVIPQIFVAVILGFMITHLFNANTLYSLVMAGFTMIIAGILVLRVEDKYN